MALALRPDELSDLRAVSAARVVAAADRVALAEGYDLSTMLVNVSEESDLAGCWSVTYLPKDTLQRGGDLTVDVRPEDGYVARTLLGQ